MKISGAYTTTQPHKPDRDCYISYIRGPINNNTYELALNNGKSLLFKEKEFAIKVADELRKMYDRLATEWRIWCSYNYRPKEPASPLTAMGPAKFYKPTGGNMYSLYER